MAAANSSIRRQRIFFRRVGEALSPYQLLEAFLKIYIGRAHLKIERLVLGKVPFHYPPSEYENAPLEWLIKMFNRHSDNKSLVKRLRKGMDARNYVAHKAIEEYMTHHTKDPKRAVKISRELMKLQKDGYDLVEAVQKELNKLCELDELVRQVLAESKGHNPHSPA